MTKDELIAAMDGLPGDTEVVWNDRSDDAWWTFTKVFIEVEDLARVAYTEEALGFGRSFWERPSTMERWERKTGWRIESIHPVIVLS